MIDTIHFSYDFGPEKCKIQLFSGKHFPLNLCSVSCEFSSRRQIDALDLQGEGTWQQQETAEEDT